MTIRRPASLAPPPVDSDGCTAPDTSWPVVYVQDIPASGHIQIIGDEARHAAGVRRLRLGENVVCTNGGGHWASGPVVAVDKHRSLTVEVHSAGVQRRPEPQVTVVQAIPKSSDDCVNFLTQVGADRIVAWHSERTIVRWGADKGDKGIQRWRRIAREASKQSRRLWFPDICGPLSTTEVLTQICAESQTIVCSEQGAQDLASTTLGSTPVTIVIGPEGGFTDGEVDDFRQQGAQIVSLGPTVLRSTTAGSVAATLVLAHVGRLQSAADSGCEEDVT